MGPWEEDSDEPTTGVVVQNPYGQVYTLYIPFTEGDLDSEYDQSIVEGKSFIRYSADIILVP